MLNHELPIIIDDIIHGFEAGSELLSLPEEPITPDTLAKLAVGYTIFERVSAHAWYHPGINDCLAQTKCPDVPEFFIITGGTASGKTELAKKTGRTRVRTATTRPPRPGEVDGVDYDFLHPDVFNTLQSQDYFAETVPLGPYLYGSPWKNIGEAFDTSTDGCVLCVVEQKGVVHLRPQIFERHGKYPNRVMIIPELTPQKYLGQIVGTRIKKLDDIKQIFWRLKLTVDGLKAAPGQTDIIIGNSFAPGGLEASAQALNDAIEHCVSIVQALHPIDSNRKADATTHSQPTF